MTGGGSSIPEVQRLLRVLAAGRRVGEAGTAFGEGAAAMAETAASVVTVERDPARAGRARARLARFPNVELLVGDWHDLLPARGPFGLLFFDAGRLDEEDPEAVVELLELGGLLVKDDLTPGRPGPDPVRDLLLAHPRLAAAEVLTAPGSAAIVAARVPWPRGPAARPSGQAAARAARW
jgi:predicted O-methyltransferase YrrM